MTRTQRREELNAVVANILGEIRSWAGSTGDAFTRLEKLQAHAAIYRRLCRAEVKPDRFILITHDLDGDRDVPELRPSARMADERTVSHALDMADCHDGPVEVWCVGHKGKVYPVSVENRSDIGLESQLENDSCVCALADMLIEEIPGQREVVGIVTYTDH